MQSMTQKNTLVVGGVDAHAATHHAAALDERGALLATKSFPTSTPGYRQLLDWLSSYGEIEVVAVESTGSYAAALVRYLREHDIAVIEVNQPHAHTRRRVGTHAAATGPGPRRAPRGWRSLRRPNVLLGAGVGGGGYLSGVPELLWCSADAVAFLVCDGGEFARGRERTSSGRARGVEGVAVVVGGRVPVG